MPFRKSLKVGAGLLAGAVIVGYVAQRAYESMIIAPYRAVQDYNTGRKVYDPLDAVFAAPVRSDEGFVCAGVTLYGGPQIGNLEVKRPTKVKVIKKYGTDANFGYPLDARQHILGVKVFDGQIDINSPNLPEMWVYEKYFKKSLPCPAAGHP